MATIQGFIPVMTFAWAGMLVIKEQVYAVLLLTPAFYAREIMKSVSIVAQTSGPF
jgi:hypothetical protein